MQPPPRVIARFNPDDATQVDVRAEAPNWTATLLGHVPLWEPPPDVEQVGVPLGNWTRLPVTDLPWTHPESVPPWEEIWAAWWMTSRETTTLAHVHTRRLPQEGSQLDAPREYESLWFRSPPVPTVRLCVVPMAWTRLDPPYTARLPVEPGVWHLDAPEFAVDASPSGVLITSKSTMAYAGAVRGAGGWVLHQTVVSREGALASLLVMPAPADARLVAQREADLAVHAVGLVRGPVTVLSSA